MILKEFLVALGYRIDASQEARFNRAVDAATARTKKLDEADKRRTTAAIANERARTLAAEQAGKRIGEALGKELAAKLETGTQAVGTFVTRLGAISTTLAGNVARAGVTIGAAATGIAAGVTAAAHRLDDLYHAAKRTGAAASSIGALRYAASQAGSSAAEATSSLEAFADAMKANPAALGLVKSLGVVVSEGGKARDTVAVLNDTIDALKRRYGGPGTQSFGVGRTLAEGLGISARLYEVDRGDRERFIAEYRETLKRAGLDPATAAANAKRLTQEWRSIWTTLTVVGERVTGNLATGLQEPFERFRGFLVDNAGRIATAVENLLRLVLQAAEAFTEWLSKTFQDDKAWDRLNDQITLLKKNLIEVKDALVTIANVLKRLFGSDDTIPDVNSMGLKLREWLFGKSTPQNPGGDPDIKAAPSAAATDGERKRPGFVRRLWNRVTGKSEEDGADVPATAARSGEPTPRGDRNGSDRGTKGQASVGFMMAIAMDQLRREGVPESNVRAAAAHLVGQAMSESGLNPNLTHDNNTGYGIYGARDPTPGRGRKTKMLAWLKEHGYAANSAEGQMRYMVWEAMNGRFPQTRRILMNADPSRFESDTNTITREFESPAVINRRSGSVGTAYRTGPTSTPSSSLPPTGAAPNSVPYPRNWNPGFTGGTFDPTRFDRINSTALAPSPSSVSNDNSRSITFGGDHRITINTTGDPDVTATAFARVRDRTNERLLRDARNVVR